jgi:hypothetical protein
VVSLLRRGGGLFAPILGGHFDRFFQLTDKLDNMSLAQDDKEDIIIETNRVTTQLQREKPRIEIIQNSLRIIEGILLGITANALTQPIIDAVTVLLGKIG